MRPMPDVRLASSIGVASDLSRFIHHCLAAAGADHITKEPSHAGTIDRDTSLGLHNPTDDHAFFLAFFIFAIGCGVNMPGFAIAEA